MADNEDVTEDAPRKGGKKKLVALVLLLAAGGAAAYMFLVPKAEPTKAELAEQKAAEEAAKLGEVLPLESIQINLADGHYLKLGLALQASATAGAHGKLDGSKALDHAIELFSGREVAELSQAKERHHLKEELRHEVEKAYHHEVLDVYFTEFVMQ